jgi:hypothetical protein
VPDQNGSVDLHAVSAAGPGNAVAVGQAQGGFDVDSRAILEWDGARWEQVVHDEPASVQLWDVDLAPAGGAWVVGGHTGPPFSSYLEHRCGE